jgi:hypothetical protein
MRHHMPVVAVLMAFVTAPVSAQLPSASTAALGMGDNYTAVARGYSTVAWNPALLGMPDNPRVSLAILPIRGIAGLDPVTLGDIADYEGEFLPQAVRERWLAAIEGEGSEEGTGGGDLTLFAAQVGHFGVQLATTSRALGNLTPGAAELILFGNYGRAGESRAFDLDGSNVSGFAASTLAISYGRLVAANMTAGATLKYTIGHVLLFGEDRGTTFTADPTAEINFPVVGTTTEALDGTNGSGLGLDLGFAMVRGPWTFGAALQNVFNTFAWNERELVFRAGLGTFDVDTHVSDFEEQEFARAPGHLQELVRNAHFKPSLALGLSFLANQQLTLTGDFRTQLSESTLAAGPDTHLGVGAEYLPTPRIPLRAGVAYVEGGYQIAGGVGANFGPVSIAVSLARRSTDLGIDTITMFTLISTTSR